MTNDIDTVLAERGSRYGKFTGQAEISQALKEVVAKYTAKRNTKLDDDMAEALSMICHKMARILNGDPHYTDHWVDICGYSKLVADRLQGRSV